MSDPQKRASIHDQFIKQYIDRFNVEINLIPQELHIARGLYLFAFTDYFGKITYVADTGDITKIDHARNNFTHLINHYFPEEFRDRSNEIYELYRCGIMHSVYPKNAGLHYLPNDQRITFKDEVGIPSQRYQIDALNLWKYEQALHQVITDFSNDVLRGNADKKVDNMQQLLTDDIFGDVTSYMKYYP